MLILVIVLLLTRVFSLSSRNNYLDAKTKAQDQKFTLWTDSMGREHARQKQTTVYLTQLTAENKVAIDSAAEHAHVKSSDVSRYTAVKTQTTAHFKATVDTSDMFAYADDHLSVQGTVTDSAKHKVVNEKITYSDVGHFTTYDTSKKFLGITFKKDTYMDVYFDDPNTHITGLTNIPLKPYLKPKHFSIGPTFGVTYITGWKPYIGFGITYGLIKF